MICFVPILLELPEIKSHDAMFSSESMRQGMRQEPHAKATRLWPGLHKDCITGVGNRCGGFGVSHTMASVLPSEVQ